MSKVVIKAENICKRYKIGVAQDDTFTGAVKSKFKNIFAGSNTNYSKNDFWALQSISFEVKEGEVLGIIGKNGAGKSTLLKILSRITLPTKGRIEIDGRVASLLEVGTGFHPELSGRENIFLNGALLGMTRSEIRQKFDEIVDFSGVEKFLDTSVKHYSSGMYVRLAFAVAAHLDPEILIIDEVLAVGDAEFQKKCLGKMNDVAKQGRTVLFVSHNTSSLLSLCQRGILLNKGVCSFDGKIQDAVHEYISEKTEGFNELLSKRDDRRGNKKILFESIILRDNLTHLKINSIKCGDDVLLEIKLQNNLSKKEAIRIDIGINNQLDQRISWCSTDIVEKSFYQITNDEQKVYLKIKNFPLMPGKYKLTFFCTVNGVVADHIEDAFELKVDAGDFFNTGKLLAEGQGSFLLQHEFTKDI